MAEIKLLLNQEQILFGNPLLIIFQVHNVREKCWKFVLLIVYKNCWVFVNEVNLKFISPVFGSYFALYITFKIICGIMMEQSLSSLWCTSATVFALYEFAVWIVCPMQTVHLYQVFLVVTGTVSSARICSKEKSLWNIMKMLLPLEGFQELTL